MKKEIKNFEEIEEVEECHLFKAAFFALLFEVIGFMAICGLYNIIVTVINHVF